MPREDIPFQPRFPQEFQKPGRVLPDRLAGGAPRFRMPRKVGDDEAFDPFQSGPLVAPRVMRTPGPVKKDDRALRGAERVLEMDALSLDEDLRHDDELPFPRFAPALQRNTGTGGPWLAGLAPPPRRGLRSWLAVRWTCTAALRSPGLTAPPLLRLAALSVSAGPSPVPASASRSEDPLRRAPSGTREKCLRPVYPISRSGFVYISLEPTLGVLIRISAEPSKGALE